MSCSFGTHRTQSVLPLWVLLWLWACLSCPPPVLSSVVELTDLTFDDTVFPSSVPFDKQQPYFIFFYAPWCGHCKSTRPIFQNASDYLDTTEFAQKHATFATVDATSQKGLAHRFHVKSFPTFYYVTRGRGYHYDGPRQLHDFVQGAIYTYHGHTLGSFADDVSSPERFEAVDVEAPGRAAFVFFIPREAPRQHEPRIIRKVHPQTYRELDDAAAARLQDEERAQYTPQMWQLAVESSITLGKTRFAVIYEDRIPNTVQGIHGGFSMTMEAVRRCQKRTKGPNDVVLVLSSDAHKKPLCYLGPWFKIDADAAGTSAPDMPRGLASVVVHKDLHDFVDANSFLAVEEISAETYASMSRRPGLLVILATNGPLTKDDENFLPLMREVVQERNALMLASQENEKSGIEVVDQHGVSARPRTELLFAHLDGIIFSEWLIEHGLSLPELPTLLAVSPTKQLAYHAKQIPEFAAAANRVPWRSGGEQHELIRRFLTMLDRGEITPFRASAVGRVAEYLLYVPYANLLHEALGSDDTTFLMVLFIVVFVTFIVAVALRPESESERLSRERSERFAAQLLRERMKEKEEPNVHRPDKHDHSGPRQRIVQNHRMASP